MFVLVLVWPCAIRALFFCGELALGQLGPRFQTKGNCPAVAPLPLHFGSLVHQNRNGGITMKKINLRDLYPFYHNDLFVEVSDEVAAAMAEAERMERN